MVDIVENAKKHIFKKNMSVIRLNVGNKVVSNNLFTIANWYTAFWIKIFKSNLLRINYMVKKAENEKNTRFFVKNVCLETKFGQSSGIQQFILSYPIEIQHLIKKYYR